MSLAVALMAVAAQAAPQGGCVVWCGPAAHLRWPAGVRVVPYFTRRLRRLQVFVLLRRLLREPGSILLSTATTAELLAVALAPRGAVAPGKVVVYVHWLRRAPRKEGLLRWVAQRQPDVLVLATTELIVQRMTELGFRARRAEYPAGSGNGAEREAAAPFRRLLVAGAARRDKGFAHVVDLVAELQRAGRSVPVSIQVSAEHYGKLEPAVQDDIERLQALRYPALELLTQPAAPAEFAALFRGAISVQPYDPEVFADRVSGVAIDALSAGCPIVVTAGTLAARMVERFDAGVVVDVRTPAALLAAIDTILADYAGYAARAAAAGRQLAQERSGGRFLATLEAFVREARGGALSGAETHA